MITLQQLHRMLDPEGPTAGALPVDSQKPVRIGFLHCVGARQIEGVNAPQPDGKVKDYCARTCCTAAMHAAVAIKERLPERAVHVVLPGHADLRPGARGILREGVGEGRAVRAVQPEAPASRRQGPLGPVAAGRAHEGSAHRRAGDRGAAGPAGAGDGRRAARHLGTGDDVLVAVGSDSFLLEVHPKLRPVELAVSGVFLAGCCQGPMDVTEACSAASAAASKAAAMISQGQVEMDPSIASVDEEVCTGCATCLTVCPYSAISRDEARGLAMVSEALCTGCGTCAATCPSAAIQQAGFKTTRCARSSRSARRGRNGGSGL